MNIVQVRHLQDKNAKRYTYKVPDDESLNKGDMVLARNANGKESVAICVTDSENLSTNAIDMIMCGAEVLIAKARETRNNKINGKANHNDTQET